jgi:hypothetical protein
MERRFNKCLFGAPCCVGAPLNETSLIGSEMLLKRPPDLIRQIGRRTIKVPVVGPRLLWAYDVLIRPHRFSSSAQYWRGRYNKGGLSGAGSYGRLAQFKADVINGFVVDRAITSVVELGCGDGAQLELGCYPRYTGIDVSSEAVALCKRRFEKDASKQFCEYSIGRRRKIKGDLSLSLDVIYHLVEDEVYQDYMRWLVDAAERFICVYSSNVNLPGHVPHVRHHCFTEWFETHATDWKLTRHVHNSFPYDFNHPDETSWADFYFFERGRAPHD